MKIILSPIASNTDTAVSIDGLTVTVDGTPYDLRKAKEIPGYEGLYRVFDNGVVVAMERVSDMPRGGQRTYPQRVITPFVTKHGYVRATLTKNGRSRAMFVHRLVALAYLDNPESKPCVNHKDGNPINNNVENLEWVTHSENTLHAIAHLGHRPMPPHKSGSENNRAKLTENTVSKIRKARREGVTFKEIGRRYGMSVSGLEKIIYGQTWRHVGGAR